MRYHLSRHAEFELVRHTIANELVQAHGRPDIGRIRHRTLSGVALNIERVSPGDALYPRALIDFAGGRSAPELDFLGPLGLLGRPKLAIFCSRQCPGSVILQAHDYAQSLRDSSFVVIGGFQSPVEKECMTVLLRARHPIIWVPARSIAKMRLKAELQASFAAGSLLILSPFPSNRNRMTAQLAEERNRVVGTLADRVFVAHAAPESRTLALCREFHATGKPLMTINQPANALLLEFAQPI